MAHYKVLPCFVVFLSFLVCLVTAALEINKLPLVNECPGDNHWPLTRIEYGRLNDVVFHKNGVVSGSGVDDELGVLSLNGSGHVEFAGFTDDCITTPDRCPNGFTVAFWLKHGGFISSILGLNSKYHTALDTWLSPLVPKKSRWLPCYRASQDGWTGADFHQQCDGKHSTLTIIKVKDFVFGGYLSKTWGPVASMATKITDPKAFLFSLNNPSGTEPVKLTQSVSSSSISSSAALTSSNSMPTFGEIDLVLKDNADTSSDSFTNPGASYTLPSSSGSGFMFTDTKYFIADEIEVFYNEALTTNQSYILTTGAENPATTGFSIFHQILPNDPANMVVKVSTKAKTWTLNVTDSSKDFRHVAITWHPTNGLKVYQNGVLVKNGTSIASPNTKNKTCMFLGYSKSISKPHCGQNILIRGLAIWRTVISVHDINTYRNVVCSPLINYTTNSFNWSQTLSSTPTALTGPNQSLPLRLFSSDKYIDLKCSTSPVTVDLSITNPNVFTACWRFRHDTPTTVKIPFEIIDFLQTQFVTLTDVTATDRWEHYCLTHSYDSILNCKNSLYKNGQLVRENLSSSVCFSRIVPSITVKIGCYDSSAFDGLLSDFNLWDRLLTSSEISLMSDSCSMIGGNLILWENILPSFTSTPVLDGICTREISYVESSYPRKKGQSVRLLTSEYVPITSNCLYFEYNLYGKDIGRLNLYLRVFKGDSQESLLWSLAGDQGSDQWKSVYISLNITAKAQVIFEGIVGDGYLGDLAIGNVALTTTDSCDGGTGKQYTAVEGIKSSIIGHLGDYKKTLQTWLSTADLPQSWSPCYSLSRRGWLSSKDLHKRCANRGPIVTLFRHSDDVFGGVFDQSLWDYGKCTQSSYIPSSKSFLFSLKSNAGEKAVQLAIQRNGTQQAFNCMSYQQYFPNFGNDLSVNLNSNNVLGKFGGTYGSTSGTFVKDQKTFVPSDFEILVPKVTFCSTTCPRATSYDEVQGKCVCDESSRFLESCKKGLFLDNFTSDAYDFFPMDDPANILNLKRAVWGQAIARGSVIATKGVGKSAISTPESGYLDINSTHQCLTNPTSCRRGVSVSIWLRYSSQVASQTVYLFCSDACEAKNTGFSIALNDLANEILNLTVTTESQRCTHEISFGPNVWTHIVFTWSTELRVYINGEKVTLSSSPCESNSYAVSIGGLMIGKGGAVDVDDFIVWQKLLNLSLVENLHDFYKGRKNMTLVFEFETSFKLDSPDKELEDYSDKCQNVQTGVKSLLTADLADKVGLDNCILSPIGEVGEPVGTNVSLFIEYSGMSGYNVAKPLIDQLRTSAKISDNFPVTKVFSLDLQTVYSTPCQLSVFGSSNFASLNWTCSRRPSAGVLSGYAFNVTNLDAGTVETVRRNSGSLFYKLKNLLYNTRYNFTVIPITLEGDGPPSEPVTLTTKRGLNAAPFNVNNLTRTSSTIRISWNYSAAEIPYTEGFRIIYKAVHIMFIGRMTVSSNVTEAVLRGLNSSTVYQITIQAYRSDMNGTFSESINASTTDGIPDASPEGVVGTPINATSITVTWLPLSPENADGTIIGYLIERFIATGENAGKNFSLKMTCNTSAILSSLYPFTDYNVSISAFTHDGLGPEIQIYISNRPKAPKQPPTSVRTVGEIGRTYVNITWDPIPAGSSLIPVSGYMIWYTEYRSSGSNFTMQINDSMSGLIEGLEDYTQYDIRVAAINSAGVGVYSSQMIVQTAEGRPRAVITNATTDHITHNTSIIHWSPLPPSDVRGVLAGYVIAVYDVLRSVKTIRIVCANMTSLELEDLFPYTEYQVFISAFTSAGVGNGSKVTTFLTLEAAPDAPPQNVTAYNASSQTIEITWRPPPVTNINGRIRGYYVTWFETFGNGQEIFNKTIDDEAARRQRRSVGSRTLQSVTLEGLKKFTMYTIRLLCFTIAHGVFSETNTTTAEDVPSVPPPNITAFNSSSTSISVSWQPIPLQFRHGVFLGYHVVYQEASQMGLTPLTIPVNQSVFNVELNNLKKFTPYIVLVAGFTTPGTGNFSMPFNVSTDQDVPDKAPVSLSVTGLSTTELSFSWQPVAADKRNGIILGYNICLHFMNTSLAKTIVINDASVLTTKTAGLLAWTNYTVKINAFTVKGPGPWSSDALVTTLEELPLPPTNVMAQMLSSTTINVTWSPSNTTFLRGILRGYHVTYTPRGSIFPNTPSNVTTSVDTFSTVLKGLHEFTEYDIAVSGFTIGDGYKSQTVVAKTDSDAPSAGPSPLGKLSATSNSITLQLGSVPPKDSNGIITGYKVVSVAVGSSDPPQEGHYGPTERWAVITGLMPYTQYLFKVFASTDKGWGSVPSNTTLRTGEAAPSGQPRSPSKIKRHSVDSIPLQWTPLSTSQANGVVLGYRVTCQLVSLGEEPVEDAPIKEFFVKNTSTLIKNLELYGRYKITVAASTAKGMGPPLILYGETCRCKKRLYTNWRSYSPYVEVSPKTGDLAGIFPEMIKQMTQECCLTCEAHNRSVVEFNTSTSSNGTSAYKDNEDDLKTNISENVDFSFPLYGTKEQKTYPGGFGYRALVESPGIVYVVNIDTGEQEGPHMTIIRSLIGCLPYVLLTILLAYLAGFVIWLLDRNINSEFFPMPFIKGTYEGLWWAFITMTTLGYGDRFPKSFWGKAFGIYWILTGIIVYGILTSTLQTAVTTITVTIDTTFNGKQIVAIHNSPEYRLGQRLNIQMNKEIQPRTFQDVYNALIQKKAYGAFIDAYAIGQQKHLFEHPNLKFIKVYDFKSAYGIVLGGTASRLSTCFHGYLQAKRKDVFDRIAYYTKFVEAPPDTLPRTVEYSTGLFTADTDTFNYTLFTLLGLWLFLMMLGSLYEVIRQKTTPVKNERCEVLEELKRDVQEFVENMKAIEQRLRLKHQQELKTFSRNKALNEKKTLKTLRKFFS